jgi:hypothetical protein
VGGLHVTTGGLRLRGLRVLLSLRWLRVLGLRLRNSLRRARHPAEHGSAELACIRRGLRALRLRRLCMLRLRWLRVLSLRLCVLSLRLRLTAHSAEHGSTELACVWSGLRLATLRLRLRLRLRER